jgi:formylglycine-generating enzyme required for sulfatase activity
MYPQDGESPRRPVYVSPFAIAENTVTNAEFARFVAETGYVTTAEQLGRSFVFKPASTPGAGYDTSAHNTGAQSGAHMRTSDNPVSYAPWWHDIESACWHAPQGAGSTIVDIPHHPVTHVSYTDALHYCDWSNTTLPTEAQWEYAARGGKPDCLFPWGNSLEVEGKHQCNVWQGDFPTHNTAADGYERTAPVDAFPPNDFGIYQMTGNVWEWVADRFTARHSHREVKDPQGPLNGDRRVTRGGSFLCHHSYCARYHVYSRQALTPQTTCENVGFRVVAVIKP